MRLRAAAIQALKTFSNAAFSETSRPTYKLIHMESTDRQ